MLAAQIVVRAPDEPAWSAPMRYDFDTDRWNGEFTVDRIGHPVDERQFVGQVGDHGGGVRQPVQ